MPNIVKKRTRPERKNISIQPAAERLALKLMQKRQRGLNFSRLVSDLIHEAAERELSDAAGTSVAGVTATTSLSEKM